MVSRSSDNQPALFPTMPPWDMPGSQLTFSDPGACSQFGLASSADSSLRSFAYSPSSLFSRSDSQPQGRHRSHSAATDVSSTDGARDAFGSLSFSASQPIQIPSTDKHAMPSSDASHDRLTGSRSSEYVGFAEDCHSHHMRPDAFGHAAVPSFSADTKAHFVADSDGPPLNWSQAWSMDGFDFELDDRAHLAPHAQTLHGSHNSSPRFSASAPAAVDWINHAQDPSTDRRSRSGSSSRSRHRAEPVFLDKPRKPGRMPGSKLPEEKRKKAAIMRLVKACNYCKVGRRSCDPGTPCKPCIMHYGPELVDHPNLCRQPIVDTLVESMLPDDSTWLPDQEEIILGIQDRDYHITGWGVDMPIKIGFGPPLRRQVQIVQVADPRRLQHQHMNLPSPSQPGVAPCPSHDHILPVVFADTGDLLTCLDKHLTMLVDNHFSDFTNHYSKLRALDTIYYLYTYYRELKQHEEYSALLQQALKLLALIHDGRVSVDVNDPSVQYVMARSARRVTPGQGLTACLLRAELGKIIPQLARTLLSDVLQKLLRICLSRRCDQHPLVIAVFAIVMMTVESLEYLAVRTQQVPSQSSDAMPTISTYGRASSSVQLTKLENSGTTLLNLYRNCFENCHRLQLRDLGEPQYVALQKSFGVAPTRFLATLSDSIRAAGNYLDTKAALPVEEVHEPSAAFDRHLARLLFLQTK